MTLADPLATDTLRSGVAITVRPLPADDRERMAASIRGLERETVYMRLFGYRTLTEAGLDRVMDVDQDRVVAIVVTTARDGNEIIIASGRYVRGGADNAEVAFTVEE